MYSALSALIPAAFKRMAEMPRHHRDATNPALKFSGALLEVLGRPAAGPRLASFA